MLNVSPTNRRRFLIMVSVAMDLSIAALLIGIFAGSDIMSALGFAADKAEPVSGTPVNAIVMCFGAMFALGLGVMTCLKALSNVSTKPMEGINTGEPARAWSRPEDLRPFYFGFLLVAISMILFFLAGNAFGS